MVQCGLGDPTPTKGPAFMRNPQFSEGAEISTGPGNLHYLALLHSISNPQILNELYYQQTPSQNLPHL